MRAVLGASLLPQRVQRLAAVRLAPSLSSLHAPPAGSSRMGQAASLLGWLPGGAPAAERGAATRAAKGGKAPMDRPDSEDEDLWWVLGAVRGCGRLPAPLPGQRCWGAARLPQA